MTGKRMRSVRHEKHAIGEKGDKSAESFAYHFVNTQDFMVVLNRCYALIFTAALSNECTLILLRYMHGPHSAQKCATGPFTSASQPNRFYYTVQNVC